MDPGGGETDRAGLRVRAVLADRLDGQGDEDHLVLRWEVFDQQLADLGYSEAQVGLADIQVDSRDPAQMKQAEATYRAAASVSPRAQARLGRLLVAKPGSTEAEHHEAETLLKKAAANGEGLGRSRWMRVI